MELPVFLSWKNLVLYANQCIFGKFSLYRSDAFEMILIYSRYD